MAKEMTALETPVPALAFGVPSPSAQKKTQPLCDIAAIRTHFMEHRMTSEDVIAPSILRSWQRASECGMDMQGHPNIEMLTDQRFRETCEREVELIHAARGEMELLAQEACSGAGGVIVLTDPQGVILHSVGCGTFAQEAQELALRPGAQWSEGNLGTNAIGAALAERDAIQVVGHEHFFEVHAVLSCSAVPIFGPSGKLAGILDLTDGAEEPHAHALALLRRAVEQIEHRLFQISFQNRDQIRFHFDPWLVGSPHEGMFAFEKECLVGANRSGLKLLGLDWSALGRFKADELFLIENGILNHGPSSDDCVARTRSGRTIYARVIAPRIRHSFGATPLPEAPTGQQAAPLPKTPERVPETPETPENNVTELFPRVTGSEQKSPCLCAIVDRLLKSPYARQLETRHMRAGQLIYGADEPNAEMQALVVVRSGRLRGFASCDGKELTLFTLDAGQAAPIDATSMLEMKKDGEIIILSLKAFQNLAQRDPELAVSAMPVLNLMVKRSLQMVEDMVFRGVRFRLIRALCEAAERYGRKSRDGLLLDEPPKAEDFAMQIGATRQSVSTIIAELVRDGSIKRRGASAMLIPDLELLKKQLG